MIGFRIEWFTRDWIATDRTAETMRMIVSILIDLHCFFRCKSFSTHFTMRFDQWTIRCRTTCHDDRSMEESIRERDQTNEEICYWSRNWYDDLPFILHTCAFSPLSSFLSLLEDVWFRLRLLDPENNSSFLFLSQIRSPSIMIKIKDIETSVNENPSFSSDIFRRIFLINWWCVVPVCLFVVVVVVVVSFFFFFFSLLMQCPWRWFNSRS